MISELNTIICGDALETLKTMPDEFVNTVVTSPPRDKNGRFIKGYSYSKNTQFIKGKHWRNRKLFWDKIWLENEYVNKQKSANDIAKHFGITENAIFFWLKKHHIPVRTIKETRQVKYWGLRGKENGMYGRTGAKNPRWNGGHSPERQTLYARNVWKELAKEILKRDNYKCQKCGNGNISNNKLVVHHIKEWARYPEFRFEKNNLITLCEKCHKKEHCKR
jgi:DNA modification methylase